MSVIDFHAHILPGIDDGSPDIGVSETMLEMAAQQNVTIIAATPHFYAGRMTLDGFLQKREEAYRLVRGAAADQGIHLVLGSETAFFSGMSSADRLEQLTIGNTPLLLLEMPFRPWGDSDLREIEGLLDRGLKPVIAHAERYYPYQRGKHIFDELYSLPVLVQINAEAFLSRKTRRLALALFRAGNAHLLGSDCHNVVSRPPNLADGRRMIEKKLGALCLMQIDRLGEEVLKRL